MMNNTVWIFIAIGVAYFFFERVSDKREEKNTADKELENKLFNELQAQLIQADIDRKLSASAASVPIKKGLRSKAKKIPLFDYSLPTLLPLHLLDEPSRTARRSIPITAESASAQWDWSAFLSRVLLGRDLATDIYGDGLVSFFDIGKNYSCLVGGGIGSGKSTLLHNIICSTVMNYSTDEVNLLLLDFKEGTEFTLYSELPHVRVLVTASDVTLGLSALNYIENEIKRRGKIFKSNGLKDFKEYREAGLATMPRWLVIVDEFQMLFYDHAVARKAEPLLDNLVRKGRAFGINFVLSTQSLLGVNIAESTLSQLGTRIALRMQERDASRFLAPDNTVPSTFTAAGMAVYNSNNGFKDSNKIIQIFPLPKSLIKHVVNYAAAKYAYGNDRFILDGASFARLPLIDDSNPNEFDKLKQISFIPGVPLDLNGNPVLLKFNKNFPERLCILGYDSDKWSAILNSWILQFSRATLKPKVTIFDFSEELTNLEFLPVNLDLEIISDHDAIESRLKDLNNTLENSHSVINNLGHMLCFFDIGAARVLRKKIFDPLTKHEIESLSRSNAINIINLGPSEKFQITVFSKRATQIEETLKQGYDSPVRSGQFDYQIIVDSEEVTDSNDRSLSEHNAFVVDNVLNESRKVILYNV